MICFKNRQFPNGAFVSYETKEERIWSPTFFLEAFPVFYKWNECSCPGSIHLDIAVMSTYLHETYFGKLTDQTKHGYRVVI